MRLFKYEDYEVKVNPEALILKPFKKLWDRDKSKTKDKATMELSFLYFFCDPRSDYQYITEDNIRLDAVKEGIGFPENWTPDEALKEAIAFYKTFDTDTARLMRIASNGVDKVQNAMDTLEPTAVGDSKKTPVDAVKGYLSVLEMIPRVASMIKDAERALNEEIEAGEAKGSIEKTLFDDGLDGIMN